MIIDFKTKYSKYVLSWPYDDYSISTYFWKLAVINVIFFPAVMQIAKVVSFFASGCIIITSISTGIAVIFTEIDKLFLRQSKENLIEAKKQLITAIKLHNKLIE